MEIEKIIGILIFLIPNLIIIVLGIIKDFKEKNHFSQVFVSGYKLKNYNENNRNQTKPKQSTKD